MKAAQLVTYDDINGIEVTDIEKPAVSEGKVLVEVHAAGLNPFDTMVRLGYLQHLQLPLTLGGDIAGIVTEVGEGVTNVKPGDTVYGSANVVAGNSGAIAEYALTSADQVALAPSNIDFEQAAALPLPGVSALQGLTEHIKLTDGQRILINGGSGGIGLIAIQIAKHLGAYVAATATGAGVEKVKAAGADEVIDYKTENAAEKLQNFDALFDTSGANFEELLAALKNGATAVTMAAQVSEDMGKDKGVTVVAQQTQNNTAKLDQLRDYVEDGTVRADVGKVYELEDIRGAFKAREEGAINGKIVIRVK